VKKVGEFVLQLILANINNTKFNSIGLGLSPSLRQSNSNKVMEIGYNIKHKKNIKHKT